MYIYANVDTDLDIEIDIDIDIVMFISPIFRVREMDKVKTLLWNPQLNDWLMGNLIMDYDHPQYIV